MKYVIWYAWLQKSLSVNIVFNIQLWVSVIQFEVYVIDNLVLVT